MSHLFPGRASLERAAAPRRISIATCRVKYAEQRSKRVTRVIAAGYLDMLKGLDRVLMHTRKVVAGSCVRSCISLEFETDPTTHASSSGPPGAAPPQPPLIQPNASQLERHRQSKPESDLSHTNIVSLGSAAPGPGEQRQVVHR
jgi:hypothetical protein